MTATQTAPAAQTAQTPQLTVTGQATVGIGPCRCSTTCPATTKNIFAQGHDARMVSRLLDDIVNCRTTLNDAAAEIRRVGGTENLVQKLRLATKKAHDQWTKRMVARDRREAAKLARQAAKVAKQVAKAAAETPVPDEHPTEVVSAKVGRWVYLGEVIDGQFHYQDKQGVTRSTAKFALVEQA